MDDLPPTLFFLDETAPRLSKTAVHLKEAVPTADDAFTFILAQLYKASESQIPIGREKLLKKAREAHIPISQHEVRTILSDMASRGMVRISKGRGGSQLTLKGREMWEMVKDKYCITI